MELSPGRRPLIQKSFYEMRDWAYDNWTEKSVLQIVSDELKHRSRNYSRKLLKEVDRRLREIEKQQSQRGIIEEIIEKLAERKRLQVALDEVEAERDKLAQHCKSLAQKTESAQSGDIVSARNLTTGTEITLVLASSNQLFCEYIREAYSERFYHFLEKGSAQINHIIELHCCPGDVFQLTDDGPEFEVLSIIKTIRQ